MAATDLTAGARAQPGAPSPAAVQDRLPIVVWLYLLVVIIPFGMQVGPLFLTGLRLLLMVMIFPLMIRLFTGQYGRVFATDILFVLHLAWATLALIANNPGAVIEQTGSVGMEFLGGYALGRAYIRTKSDFIALARALIALVLLMMPFAVIETLTGRALWLEVLQALPGVRTVANVQADARQLFGMTLERVQVGFAHPIHFGLFCSVTFSMCFVALEGTFSTPRRWITGILLAITACLALSSGAILAVVLQIGLIVWAMMFASVKQRWWILVGLMVLAYVVIDLLSNRTPIQVFMSYATFSAQTAYWRALIFEWGMKNVWMNPLLGLGLNDWIRPAFMHSSSIDNFWLLNAMRYGIPAFLLVTAGYILVLIHLMRRDFSADPVLSQLRRAWVFTFLGLSFTLCTVHVWTAIYSFTFFLLGAGMWMITVLPEDPAEDNAASGDTPKGPVFARAFTGPAHTRPMDAPKAQDGTARYSRFSGRSDTSDESP